ncbi:hypothetical protein [Rhodoplanes roseus]|uniref:Uncharacterized protein n=1 Tax=Rhodoplanes roseus TaxID=29409 RepID=A0A327KX76_9BRAD|nr:hypothetical protein [Rhodoplanes roseus]RAI41822.1 hypothetical protein CH341_20875 [Rhodoplanes roseus]
MSAGADVVPPPGDALPPASSPAGDAPDRRLATVRRRSDQLWTLLFCVGCCLDVLTEVTAELDEPAAWDFRAAIARVRERTAEIRHRLEQARRPIERRSCEEKNDVVWCWPA